MEKHYTYCYLDPRKPGRYRYSELPFSLLYEPIYVGKGKGERWKEHFKGGTNNHLYNKCKLIERETSKKASVLVCFETFDEKEAFAFEIKMIKSIGRRFSKDGSLCNYNAGGEGNTDPDLHVRLKIGQSLKHYYKENPISEEVKQQMSERRKGVPRYELRGRKASEETRRKLRKANGGYNNGRACLSLLIVDPQDNLYYVPKGTLGRFCKALNCYDGTFIESARNFAKTGLIHRGVHHKMKGWYAVFIPSSNNSQNITIGNQQLSLLQKELVRNAKERVSINPMKNPKVSNKTSKTLLEQSARGIHSMQIRKRLGKTKHTSEWVAKRILAKMNNFARALGFEDLKDAINLIGFAFDQGTSIEEIMNYYRCTEGYVLNRIKDYQQKSSTTISKESRVQAIGTRNGILPIKEDDIVYSAGKLAAAY